MNVDMQEYIAEGGDLLTGKVRSFRKNSAATVREAITGSAETLKALKSPVRMIARSGVKLTSVSQTAVQSLIELQSDVVTSALTDVALRLERATRAENIIELVREQIELTPATRARMAEDATRVVTIVKVAGRDFRSVATEYVAAADRRDFLARLDAEVRRSKLVLDPPAGSTPTVPSAARVVPRDPAKRGKWWDVRVAFEGDLASLTGPRILVRDLAKRVR